jgi:hypothetical protein
MIMFMGRWKSLPSCLGYVEVTLQDFDHAQLLLNQGALTTEDVRLITIRSTAVNEMVVTASSSFVESADLDPEDHLDL